VTDDPFGALGLPARAGATDDDVRAAWRRIAAATHPDREDGGDPARFAAAAAAYATLRTGYGRGEALADLPGREVPRRARGRYLPYVPLGLRVLAAAAVSAFAVLAAGWTPASVGVLAGALTWLIAAMRR
jgi:hypothetical protein